MPPTFPLVKQDETLLTLRIGNDRGYLTWSRTSTHGNASEIMRLADKRGRWSIVCHSWDEEPSVEVKARSLSEQTVPLGGFGEDYWRLLGELAKTIKIEEGLGIEKEWLRYLLVEMVKHDFPHTAKIQKVIVELV